MVVKLHGHHQFSPLNTEEETQRIEPGLADGVRSSSRHRKLHRHPDTGKHRPGRSACSVRTVRGIEGHEGMAHETDAIIERQRALVEQQYQAFVTNPDFRAADWGDEPCRSLAIADGEMFGLDSIPSE